MYNSMIYGCSLDDKIAPERALDLFSEMIEKGVKPDYATYHALIRTCARSKDDTFYFEALRLLKELLERNFRPEKVIFGALLEGAKPRADLARAKWIVGNMVKMAAQGSQALQPDDRIVANLLLTYATYKPPVVAGLAGSRPPSRRNKPKDDENGESKVDFNKESEEILQEGTSTLEGDEVATMPSAGRLLATGTPGNRTQILAEAKEIMSTIFRANDLGTEILSVSGSDQEPATISAKSEAQKQADATPDLPREIKAVFANVPITAHLLNAYFTVLVAHTPSRIWYPFFQSAFTICNVQPNHNTWDILFDMLERPIKKRVPNGRGRTTHIEKARESFSAWRDWLTAQRGYDQTWRDAHVSAIWTRMINIEAKSHKPFSKDVQEGESRTPHLDAAISLLEEFAVRYPASDIVEKARADVNTFTGQGNLPAEGKAPSYLVQMSSFLYPETSDAPIRSTSASTLGNDAEAEDKLPPAPSSPLTKAVGQTSTPPHLTFQGIYVLFHRLTEIEDRVRAGRVKDILGKYSRALEQADEIRRMRERGERREVRETRKRLLLGKIGGDDRRDHAGRLEEGDRPRLFQEEQQDVDARSLDRI